MKRIRWSLFPVLALSAALCLAGVTPAAAADDDFPQAKSAAPSMPLTPSGKWSMEKILSMDREKLFAIWKDLPAAPMNELNGHYMGLVPNAGHPAEQAETAGFMYNEGSERGYWLGKAYKAHSETKGEGYNRWRFEGGKVVRNLRFATEAGKSLIDGKPALMMYYGAFNDSDLVDEIRKLDEYVYVGVGTRPAPDGKRTNPVGGIFVLLGPTDAWVGVEGEKPKAK